MNLEQAENWIGKPLTEDEVQLIDYLSKGTVNGDEHVLVCTAFGLGKATLLSEQIPELVLEQVYGFGAVSELTLAGLTLNHTELDVDGTPSTIFALSANYKLPNLPVSRKRPTSATDVNQWLGLTAGFNITILTATERAALLSQSEEV